MFSVKVVPGSSRSRVAGLYGEALKVNLAVPAEKGKANRELFTLLGKVLGRPKTDISLRRGRAGPRKEVYIADMTGRQLQQKLADYLE